MDFEFDKQICGLCDQEVDISIAKTRLDVAHLLLAHLRLECPAGIAPVEFGALEVNVAPEMNVGPYAEAKASAELAGATPPEGQHWGTKAAQHFEKWDLVSMGGVLLNTHHERMCRPPCCIHSPSNHHMRAWTQHWSQTLSVVFRCCPHGEMHPDPDDLQARRGNVLHRCDGCCLPPDSTGHLIGV